MPRPPKDGWFRSDRAIPGWGYSLFELKLIIEAAAYEIYHVSLVSDFIYDAECRTYAQISPQRIKNFSPDTGMWVHKALTPALRDLTERMIGKVRAEKDEYLHHTYIARDLGVEP